MARAFNWSKAKGEKLVAERGSERVDDPRLLEPFVPAEKRKQMQTTRKRLLAEFAALPPAKRARREREFRKRLKANCPTSRGYQGAWEQNFASLLPASAKQPASRMKANDSAAKGRSRHRNGDRPAGAGRTDRVASQVAEATVSLVKANPDVMTQRMCVHVLAGVSDAKILPLGLHHAPQFGQFRGTDREKLRRHVQAAVTLPVA